MDEKILFKIKNISKHYPIYKGVMKKQTSTIKAVDNVSFTIYRGEALGLVGESGCGKTTLGRAIIRAFPVTSGSVIFNSKRYGPQDIAGLTRKDLKPYRREMQLIFQDPYASLNPRLTVQGIVGEPLVVHNVCKGKVFTDKVIELLEMVGLEYKHMHRFPHAFSGGQRQRIGIARALALNPEFIVADEAVSALDVSVQAQILNLLKDLKAKFNLTYLFITHDLNVVRYLTDRIIVMYVGKIVEVARTEDLFNSPLHPYTEALLSSLPVPDPTVRGKEIILEGEIPNPSNPPSGCYFHPRCPYAEERCRKEAPQEIEVSEGHTVFCHRYS